MDCSIIEAWHFLPNDGRVANHFRHGKKSPFSGHKVSEGEVLVVEGSVVPEIWGLHASKHVVEALFWAAGLVLCKVVLSGKIVKGDKKYCANSRQVTKIFPRLITERLIRGWATDVAERHYKQMSVQHKCLHQCIEASREIIKFGKANTDCKYECRQLYKLIQNENDKRAAFMCMKLIDVSGQYYWRSWAARPKNYNDENEMLELDEMFNCVNV